MEPVAPGATLRPTARVLLLDERDRLLLFRGTAEATGEPFWFPPGGAVEPSESPEDAAVREVREETGADIALGSWVWTRRHVVGWGGVLYDVRERWFLAWVSAFDIDTSGFVDSDAAAISGHRWWAPDELHRAEDRLVPADLATRLADLLAHGPPAAPVEVGI